MSYLEYQGGVNAIAAVVRAVPDHGISELALLVQSIDLDLLEAHLDDASQTIGISPQRLRSVIREARRATNEEAPLRSNQHLVSRVLLKQFVGDSEGSSGLLKFDISTGLVDGLQDPRSQCVVRDFVKIDSEHTEMEWEKVESRLDRALTSIRAAKGIANQGVRYTITRLIALHYARSLDVKEIHERLWHAESLQDTLGNSIPDSIVEQMFYARYGFYPPDANAARRMLNRDFINKTRSLVERGTTFRLSVVSLYQSAKKWIRESGLRIIVAPSGSQFLIGDVPAVTISPGRGAVGLRAGVPIGNARAVALPLSPDLAVFLNRNDEFGEVTPDVVDQVNEFQIRAARESIFFRPGSGLENFVATKVREFGLDHP